MAGPPIGACCFGLVCVGGLTASQCKQADGFWQGPGSVCTPTTCNPTPPPPEPPTPPPPQSLILSGIECTAFIQFLEGRRNSVIIELQYPPFLGQTVVLKVDPECPPYPGPNVINTTIKSIILNDTFLSSKKLYTITLEI